MYVCISPISLLILSNRYSTSMYSASSQLDIYNDVDGNKIDLPTLPLDDDGDLVVSPQWSLTDASKSLFNKIDQQNVKGFLDELKKCPASHIDELANARCDRTNKYRYVL